MTLRGIASPSVVKLRSGAATLKFGHFNNTVTVQLPLAKRTKLVDVEQVDLSSIE